MSLIWIELPMAFGSQVPDYPPRRSTHSGLPGGSHRWSLPESRGDFRWSRAHQRETFNGRRHVRASQLRHPVNRSRSQREQPHNA